MHSVRLKLKTTISDEHIIEKRFNALWHVHNVFVKHASKLLKKLQYDEEYQSLRNEYCDLLKKPSLSREESKRKNELGKAMKETRNNIGLSKSGLEAYGKDCGGKVSHLLSSQQVQKESLRVYTGVEKILFGNGKQLHYKRKEEITTIPGKSIKNGVKFNPETLSIDWIGLKIPCKRNDSDYIAESLNHDISYCEIERLMFPNGWHYYVVIYLKGDAPMKNISTNDDTSITGVDIGTSTVATVSNDSAQLMELAPRCHDFNKRINKLQNRMDISRRMSNPDKYNDDGTINRNNRDKWVYSNTYYKNRRKLRTLYRQKQAYIKQSHEEQINKLLSESVNFVAEQMSFKGLQRKAKNTVRSDKPSEVKQNDGSVKKVFKFKRKKRYGRSMNNRAPSLFLRILERKAKHYGGQLIFVDTAKFKASQYNHINDSYIKSKLSDRQKCIDGHIVQRDMYSAFLLKNTDSSLTKPDRTKCINDFNKFVELHDKTINEMKQNSITMKYCFGF